MDRTLENRTELEATRPYESPVVRTHRRDELAATAMPINACTTFDPLEDQL